MKLLAASSLVAGTAILSAQPLPGLRSHIAFAADEGAVVVYANNCGILARPPVVPETVTGGTGVFVFAPSGVITLHCHVQTALAPSEAQVLTQTPCGNPSLGFGTGTIVVTPNGEVDLHCTIKPSQ